MQFLLQDAEPLLHGNEPIRCDGKTVGYIRAGAFGPTLGASVGLGVVELAEGVTADLVAAADGKSRSATGWCPPPPRSHRCTTRKASVSVHKRLRPDVLVLGAGMAGLGAARALKDAGVPVTVIEARDRIGGRTHTSHLWPDLPVDMGASWIHGTKGNPLTALADELGLKVTPTTYDRSATFDENGREIEFTKAAQRALALVEKARSRIDDADRDMSLQDAIESSPQWRKLPDLDRRIARLVINTRIEHEYSGDWSAMSAWHFDDGKDMSGHEAVVTPGYGPMAEHLARGLDLRLGETVLGIAPCADGVEVTTTRGTHRAGHAIVTLPLGVLQSGRVAFGEPLAPARQRAIDSLGMGLLNKCVLRFDRVFWPPEVDWIDFLGPTETLWADWTSYLRATGRPLLGGLQRCTDG